MQRARGTAGRRPLARTAAWGAVAVACALLIGLALAQAFASSAEAHATLVRSNPRNGEQILRAPLRVTLQFSEPIERDLTTVEVTNMDGDRVDDGQLNFDDDDAAFVSVGLQELEPGLYSIEYSNVSTVDGHPWSGIFEFILLNPDGSVPEGAEFTGGSTSGTGALPKPLDVILKWAGMTALAIAAGVALFLLVIYRPAARFLQDDAYKDTVDAGERWVVSIAHVMLPVAFIASALLIVATVSRFETTTNLWDYLTTVRAGQYRGLQLIAIAVALVGADVLFLAPSRRARDVGHIIFLIASFAALLFYPLVSHAASNTGRFWSVSADYTHIAVSSVWLGALVMLSPVLRSRSAGDGAQRFLFQANVFDRFSILAGLSVAVIMSTGLFNALVEFPTWASLYETTYGRVMIAKLVIIAPLLAVAGLNAFVLKPRLVRSIDEQYQEREQATAAEPRGELPRLQRWLPRTIIAEVALVIAVFASVGVLTQTTSAKSEVAADRAAEQAAAAYDETFEQDGLRFTLSIRPNLVGRNQFEVVVTDDAGAPAANVSQTRLRFQYEGVAGSLPQSELVLNEREEGTFSGESAVFSQPGNWRLEIGLRRTDGDDVSRIVILSVAEPVNLGTDDGGPFALPFDTITWNRLVGFLLLFIGVLLMLYRPKLRWLPGAALKTITATAVVALVGGGILVWSGDNHGAAGDPTAGNPVDPTDESVARGLELYQQNCVTCHGVNGDGNGPTAPSLNPAPSDFRLHVPIHTDVELFTFIADGYAGTAMPAWRDELSEEDIWNLVNFLRANFSEAPSQ